MNSGLKRNLRILRDYIIGWTVSMVFLSIVRGVGTIEAGSLQFTFQRSLMISFTLGPIIGIISGYAEIWMESKIYRRVSILTFLGLRLFWAIVLVLVLVLAAYSVYYVFFGIDMSIIEFGADAGSGAIMFYIIVVDLFISILRQINMMLGPKKLNKFLLGKFYRPSEEDRLFMFLDLQSSTTLAEQLGHLKYSYLIQDCFTDLSVTIADEAEVYQYVGDEAVLTWSTTSGLRDGNFLNAFFRFKDQLESRRAHYEDNYGVLPFFKAGVHGGIVAVTEIGKYKKEIAYHGDPINTAARIQGKCNELGADLLISATLVERLNHIQYTTKKVGSVLLRGKEKEVGIYSVVRN